VTLWESAAVRLVNAEYHSEDLIDDWFTIRQPTKTTPEAHATFARAFADVRPSVHADFLAAPVPHMLERSH
jgi:hypothetical protein